jgi:asparagine synthase (glutamine-hydrolysing)
MSGGVDSTTISVMASRLYPGIKAFTLGFDKTISRYDETEEAIATAQMNNIDHIVSFLKADVVLDNIEQMVLGYEEPFYHLAPNYAISKIVADHGVKVVFSGLGGDELFAGYALYARWIKFKKFNNFSWLAGGIPYGLSKKMDRFKLMVQAETAADFYTQSYTRFNESELISLFGFNGDAQGRIKRNYLGKDKEFSDDIELLSYLDIKHYIGNHHVHRIDQFTMAHGVEGRFPFLDHHLIEASARIPSKYKIQPGVQKKVLRNVASKYIHPSCLSMKKKGFGLPLARWYSDELNVLAQDALEGLKKRSIFNITAVDSIISHGSVTHKWQLVMTELWMRSFIDTSFYDESI